MKLILDNSVIAKWFLEESDSEKALVYLKDFVAGKFILVVPTLLFYELGNVFWKKKVSPQEISKVMIKLQSFADDSLIQENVGFTSFRKVYETAKDYNITYYDAAYVLLMQKHQCNFITADKKLHTKLKTVFTDIKLL